MELHEFKDRFPQHLLHHNACRIQCMYNTTDLRLYHRRRVLVGNNYNNSNASSAVDSSSSMSSSREGHEDHVIGSSGEYLFVGTSDGHVLKFAIVSRQNMLGDSEIDIQLLETFVHNRQGKPIQKMACDDELGVLFIMCQGQLDMVRHYDHAMAASSRTGDGNIKMGSTGVIRIKEAAGLSTFSLDHKTTNTSIGVGSDNSDTSARSSAQGDSRATSGQPGQEKDKRRNKRSMFAHRLCVSVKRRLLFLQYTHDSYRKLEEHVIPETCHEMVFYGQTLLLGMKREYTIVRLDNKVSLIDDDGGGGGGAHTGSGSGRSGGVSGGGGGGGSSDGGRSDGGRKSVVGALANVASGLRSGRDRRQTVFTSGGSGSNANSASASEGESKLTLQSTQIRNVSTVLELDRNMKPLVVLMDNEAILRRNNLCVLVNLDTGAPTARNAIVWSDTPIDITVCYPYIVAQLPHDKLEVFNIFETNPKLVETHVFRTSGSGSGSGSGRSSGGGGGGVFGINALVKEALSDFKGDDGFQDKGSVFAAHTTNQNGIKRGIFLFQRSDGPPSIHLLQPIAFDKQVKALINKCRCEEAFELFQKTLNINLVTGQKHLNKALKMKLQKLYEDSGYAMLLNSDSDFSMAKDAFEKYFSKCAVQSLDMRHLLGYFFDKQVLEKSSKSSIMSPRDTQYDGDDVLLSTIYKKSITSKRSNLSTAEYQSLNLDAMDTDVEKLAYERFNRVKHELLRPFLEQRRDKCMTALRSLEANQEEFLSARRGSIPSTSHDDSDDPMMAYKWRQNQAGTAMKLEEQLRLIDNALLRLYLEIHNANQDAQYTGSRMSPLERLLRQEPLFCDLQESKRALLQNRDTAFYLALLLKAHGMLDESLQLLHDIGSGHNLAMGLSMGFKEGDAQRAASRTHEHRKALEETIRILSSIDRDEHKHLVFKYAKWAIQKNPDEAIRIFKRPSAEHNILRPEEVLQFLAREFRGAGTTSQSEQTTQQQKHPEWLRRFILQYLEHLLVDQGNVESQLHTQLAILYIDDILRWRQIRRSRQKRQQKTRDATVNDSDDQEIAEPMTGTYAELRTKLRFHLERSSFYHFDTIAARLQKTGLFEERIIVYRKMGRHEEALKIILFDLGDLTLAENYCLVTTKTAVGALDLDGSESVPPVPDPTSLPSPLSSSSSSFRIQAPHPALTRWPSTTAAEKKQHNVSVNSLISGDNYLSNPLRSKLFLVLLSLCFHPPPMHPRSIGKRTHIDPSKYRKFAIDIANIHATKINPLKALALLPEDIPMQDLSLFLSRAVRESEFHCKSISILKNLSKAETFQVEYELNCISRERRVTVSHKTRCGVCFKRIAPSHTRAVFPDNSVFHLSCIQDNKHVHPVTKRNFLVEPVDKLYYRSVRSSIDSRIQMTRVDPASSVVQRNNQLL